MTDLLQELASAERSQEREPTRPDTQVNGTASRLLRSAEVQLRLARRPDDVFERFSHTHYAALRLAGSVLAVAETAKRVPKGQSIWDRLERRAPGLSGWAQTFERSAKIRSMLELGRLDVIDPAAAESWLAIVEEFRAQVFAWFGLDPLLDFDSQYTFAA